MPTADAGRAPRPRKSLGQNFLCDPAVVERIVRLTGLTKEHGVLEIGPGTGALTRALAQSARFVAAVELDRALIPPLEQFAREAGNVRVVEGDILKVDLGGLFAECFDGMPAAVYGNIPYYITSPILFRLLEDRIPADFLCLMMQKEAAVRFCAEPGSRESGASSLAVRMKCVPEILFDVRPGSFRPAPKVMSSVVRFTPRAEPPVKVLDEALMMRIVRAGFLHRRKTLANALVLGGFGREQILEAMEEAGIDPGLRAERLTLGQYAALADAWFGKFDEKNF